MCTLGTRICKTYLNKSTKNVHICICICFHFVYISIIKHLLHDNKIANNNKIANTYCMSPHGDFTQAPHGFFFFKRPPWSGVAPSGNSLRRNVKHHVRFLPKLVPRETIMPPINPSLSRNECWHAPLCVCWWHAGWEWKWMEARSLWAMNGAPATRPHR